MAIKERFLSRGMGEVDLGKSETIRNYFGLLAAEIEEQLPDNRYRSVALTNLEQASMWATRSLSHKDVK